MGRLKLLLCFLVVMVTVWAETDLAADVKSVSFNETKQFVTASGYVHHVELDLYNNDGSLLFSADKSLYTTDGKTTSKLTTISGSMTGFKQLNSTRIALVDHHQHCIRVFNRVDSSVQPLAGTCGTHGYAEGRVGTGRLHNPWGIEVDIKSPGRLLVTDYSNKALRSVDLQTGELGTVVKSGLNYPRGMVWADNALLITNYHCISEVSWSKNGVVNNCIVAGSTSDGNTDGSFSEAKFNSPYDLIKIADDLYLVADVSNKKLRLLNMKTQRVGPVCTNGESPCITGSQLPSYPRSLLKVNSDVYVGTAGGGIYKLSGGTIPELQHCPYDNITAYVQPGDSSAKVQLPGGDVGRFLPGIHPFTRERHFHVCSYQVNILVSPVIRTAVFKAEYDVTCDVLNNNATKGFLETVLQHRRDQLADVCGKDCGMSTSLQPSYTCDNDLLVVNWPTDQVFAVDVKALPDLFSSSLKKRLSATNFRFMEIVVLSHRPPLVFAKQNQKGESVQIVLSGRCADGKLAYDVNRDTCI